MDTYYLFRNQSKLPYRYYFREDIDDLHSAETIILNEEDMNYVKECFSSIKPLDLTSYTQFSNAELKEAIKNLKDFEARETCPVSKVILTRLIKYLSEVFDHQIGLFIESNL